VFANSLLTLLDAQNSLAAWQADFPFIILQLLAFKNEFASNVFYLCAALCGAGGVRLDQAGVGKAVSPRHEVVFGHHRQWHAMGIG
jgi:hypothetical protein